MDCFFVAFILRAAAVTEATLFRLPFNILAFFLTLAVAPPPSSGIFPPKGIPPRLARGVNPERLGAVGLANWERLIPLVLTCCKGVVNSDKEVFVMLWYRF